MLLQEKSEKTSILNLRLQELGHDKKASIAVYSGQPIDEFITLIKSYFNLFDFQILGFRGSNGLLVSPNLICMNIDQIKNDEYEILIRGLDNRPTSSTYQSRRNLQIRRSNVIKTNSRQIQRPMTAQNQNNFHSSQTNERPFSSKRSRQVQNFVSNEFENSQKKFMQVINEMEQKNLISQQELMCVRAKYFEQNQQILDLMNQYNDDQITIQQLSEQLIQITNVTQMERPQSPDNVNQEEVLQLLKTLTLTKIKNQQDVQILQELVQESDEVVFSAYEMYQADKDTEELLDTLQRCILKWKEQKENFQTQEDDKESDSSNEQIDIKGVYDQIISEHELTPFQYSTISYL